MVFDANVHTQNATKDTVPVLEIRGLVGINARARNAIIKNIRPSVVS
jgi:hypothetical protein